MRLILGRLLLALAVVLFQHGAVAHAVAHLEDAGHQNGAALSGDAEHHDDEDAHTAHGCDACHAYAAAYGGGPPAPAVVLLVPRDTEIVPAAAHARPPTPPFHPFDSRAPPART